MSALALWISAGLALWLVISIGLACLMAKAEERAFMHDYHEFRSPFPGPYERWPGE